MSTLREFIIAGCVLFFPGITAAQQDSSIPSHTEAFRLQYDRYANEAISQPLLKYNNYSSVQVGYRSEDGGYRQTQAPKKQGDLFFYTEGTRQIKKFLVSGSFGWQNIQADSVAYALRYDHNDPNPYYFFAEKPGNWQIIRYHLQGLVSTPLLQNKLVVGAGAKYNSHNGWRGNDPRPEEFNYNLEASATAHYKLSKHQTIGASGGYIRKNSDIDWGYRNEDNVNVTNLKVYLLNGYGNVEPLTGLKSGTISNAKTGYNISGIYEGDFSFGIITLSGKYQHTSTDIFRKPVEQYERRVDYADFDEQSYEASASWLKTTGKNIFQAQFNYRDEQGKDYNFDLAGTNYVYALEQANLQALYSRLNENGKMKYELGASAQFRKQLKKDASVSQHAAYQTGEAALNGACYFYFPSQKSMLKTAVRAAYSHPFEAKVNHVKQSFSFTEGVVYRDYYYFNANNSSIGANLTYQFPIKKISVFIQAGGMFLNASMPDSRTDLAPYSYPGTDRVYWQCSIGVNL